MAFYLTLGKSPCNAQGPSFPPICLSVILLSSPLTRLLHPYLLDPSQMVSEPLYLLFLLLGMLFPTYNPSWHARLTALGFGINITFWGTGLSLRILSEGLLRILNVFLENPCILFPDLRFPSPLHDVTYYLSPSTRM